MKEKMKVKKKKKMCSISNVADVQRYQWRKKKKTNQMKEK
jgi:hypothetical protein